MTLPHVDAGANKSGESRRGGECEEDQKRRVNTFDDLIASLFCADVLSGMYV